MDLEQLVKQVDWLDEERRKDKTQLGSIEERIIAVEENIPGLAGQIKELRSDINRLAALLTRIENIEENILQQRIETKQYFDELDRRITKVSEENEKVWLSQIKPYETKIGDINKQLSQLPTIQRRIDDRVEEENRLSRSLDELRAKISDIRRSEEEYTRTIRLFDDGRRQDAKRISDIQSELITLHKQSDEQSGKIELNSVSTRKLETRINEFDILEADRREVIENFLEKQSLLQVEREREWKLWQTRFDQIEQQTMDVDKSLQNLDITHRDVKRTQQNVDELTQKLDRRINELTEIQRLSEERFRQEWVTFKADDQKRWTNYMLTQEEQQKGTQRQQEKVETKVTELEDTSQEIIDLIQQTNELEEKRLQSIRALIHEWVTEFERVVGTTR